MIARLALISATAVAALLAGPAPAAAQHGYGTHTDEARRSHAAFGAHAVPLVTYVTPILRGRSRTEAYITQPTLFGAATALNGALELNAAVSLEALTIADGELGAGAYGEGFVDRRHPHTWLHELMLTAAADASGVRASLAAGRGFVPFGTDDPMTRPFVKFPVNHHLGQILERLVVIGGLAMGAAALEGALFNGNEPSGTDDLGSIERFGDSWAARLTLTPVAGVELQASHAWVTSPEFPLGGGWDQRKWSAAARVERSIAGVPWYALLEWKRTTQVDNGSDVFSFGSVLVEAAADLGAWRPALRLERSERPEEERLADPFRTHWPHGGGHVLGITRWNIIGARVERALSFRAFRSAPFVEASFAHVQDAAEGPFSATELYGSRDIWTVNAGVRLQIGTHPARMGRYGIAAAQHEH